jgi:hypothetical protein
MTARYRMYDISNQLKRFKIYLVLLIPFPVSITEQKETTL